MQQQGFVFFSIEEDTGRRGQQLWYQQEVSALAKNRCTPIFFILDIAVLVDDGRLECFYEWRRMVEDV